MSIIIILLVLFPSKMHPMACQLQLLENKIKLKI